jgi:hypothetical protein
MTQKQNIRLLLVTGLVVVSLGGWLLHIRVHPVSDNPTHWIPFLTGLVGIIVLPAMFLSKKTLPYAYILNGMFVIIGTITMAHVSVPRMEGIVSLESVFVKTLFADIAILWVNFFIGNSLFELEMFKVMDAAIRKGRFFRYPNMGYWCVHVVALSVVYVFGYVLWK